MAFTEFDISTKYMYRSGTIYNLKNTFRTPLKIKHFYKDNQHKKRNISYTCRSQI